MDNPVVAIRKTSLVDYPGKVSSVLFFQGCNLHCPWCHNPELAENSLTQSGGGIPLNGALDIIRSRRSLVGAVVISGGEPSLYSGIGKLIETIKSMGLLAKLDTNGTFPEILDALCRDPLSRPDFISLDLKISPRRYGGLAKNQKSGTHPGEALEKSAGLISCSGIAHEFRTLILPENYITPGDIPALAALVDESPWVFRPFIPGNCMDETWNGYSKTSISENHPIIRAAKSLGKNVVYHQ